MSAVEFRSFGKIPRLNRDMVITEKINGTNAAIRIVPMDKMDRIGRGSGTVPQLFDDDDKHAVAVLPGYAVFAQSRNRLITPEFDNHGFAKWVQTNAMELASVLGEGLHFGEFWGNGIQHGYGLKNGDKRFSLFNVIRHAGISRPEIGLGTVPVLYEGDFDTETIDWILEGLIFDGSTAVPGYMNPEGIVIFHKAANSMFKVTCEHDESPKSLVSL